MYGSVRGHFCRATTIYHNLKLINMKTIKFLILALYFCCAIFAMMSLCGEYFVLGGFGSLLGLVFGLGALGTVYSMVSKSKSEYKPLPVGTDFILLVIQVVTLLWSSVEQFKIPNTLSAILLILCALFGGYLAYLWIIKNKK